MSVDTITFWYLWGQIFILVSTKKANLFLTLSKLFSIIVNDKLVKYWIISIAVIDKKISL